MLCVMVFILCIGNIAGYKVFYKNIPVKGQIAGILILIKQCKAINKRIRSMYFILSN